MLLEKDLVEMMQKEVKEFKNLLESGDDLAESEYTVNFKVVAEDYIF